MMKRIVSALAALLLFCALEVPARADFVPSISFEGFPELVTVYDQNGSPKVGVVKDNAGNVVSYVDDTCMAVTSVAKANTSAEIPAQSKATLMFVYDALTSGSMKLPYEKMGSGLSEDNTAIRDLFDISWLCSDHPEMLAPAGVTLTLIFDLGIPADAKVHVLTYKNSVWNPIVSVVNNSDGTLTCVFEDLCPVAFVIETGAADTGLLGDVNSDGLVNSKDAMLMLRWDAELIGADELNLNVGDVDGDNQVNSKDAMWVLRYDAELIEKLPADSN